MRKENEKGFTLLELILVLAIMVVFITSMATLLVTITKMSSSIIKENEGKSVQSLLFPHVERSLRKYDRKNSISVQTISSYDPVLVIDTDVTNVNSLKLYYFYEASDEVVYFQAGTTFDPANKNQSIQVATRIKSFQVTLSANHKNLQINAEIEFQSGLQNYRNMFTLKAN